MKDFEKQVFSCNILPILEGIGGLVVANGRRLLVPFIPSKFKKSLFIKLAYVTIITKLVNITNFINMVKGVNK